MKAAELYRALQYVATAPTRSERERALLRLQERSGRSIRSLRRTLETLGLDLSEDAGAEAMERYRRNFRLSIEGSKLFADLNSRLERRLLNLITERNREMLRPMSLREAARTLNVPTWQLRRWIRWFGVLPPNEEGKITPQQLLAFMHSSFKWLLPYARLGRL